MGRGGGGGRIKRALIVAKLLQDDAEARERTEMARLARQHLVDIGKREVKVLFRIVDRWAPVPCLGEVRPYVDGGVEQPDRKVEILAVGGSFGAAHQQIGGIAAGGEPNRPDAVLYIFGALVVRRDFERRKQAVEVFRLVAALGPRQRARRLHPFYRPPVHSFGPRPPRPTL